MKSFFMGLAALAMTATAVPAEAQRVSGEISVSIGDRDRYRDNRDYRRDVYRDYFRHQRSYWRGRCHRNEVVVRDPYTGRRVCMHRRDYNRWMHDRRQYRF